jgi:hypothetical protein
LPVALSKAEFVERAAKWGAARGFKFKTSLLNRWINEGLLAEGDRGGNVGKHPVYRYSCRHYRRVLQVLRLYVHGLLASFSQPEFIAAHFALPLTLLKRFPVEKGEFEKFLQFAIRGFS